MKTLKLSDEKALELYKTADNSFKELLEENFGKEFFKPKLITDIVYDLDSLADYLKIKRKELFIFSETTKDEHERYINACNILVKIAEIYNEGTILDWKNFSIYKWIPYLDFYNSGVVSFNRWYSYLSGGSILYYKSEILAKQSYNNFQNIWEDYWGI